MPQEPRSVPESGVPVSTTGQPCPGLRFEDNLDSTMGSAEASISLRVDDALNALPEGLIIGHLVRSRGWRHDGIACIRRGWGARG